MEMQMHRDSPRKHASPRSLTLSSRRANIEPYAWVINSSLLATSTTDPFLQARAASERMLIDDVRNQKAVRTFIVPWQANPPIGAASLHELIGAPVK